MRKQLLITAFLCFFPLQARVANVLFDMNGVVVHSSGLKSMQLIGINKIFNLLNSFGNPFSLKPRLFEFLNAVEARHPDETDARDPQGRILPQLMCDWLKGTRTPEETMNYIDQAILKGLDFDFSCDAEYAVLHAIAHMMFTPELFVQITRFSQEAINFICELKANGHKPYILSNWDAHSFAILQEQNPFFFELFDGIVLSAHARAIKPDPAIYHHILNKYHLNSADCFFIDDQEVNIEAAAKLGIAGCVCPQRRTWFGSKAPHIQPVREAFDSWQAVGTEIAA